jgi:hypothetical protein
LAVVAIAVMVRTDLAQLRWVSELSMQGSPPPAIDPSSPTGYALGQRHFLGAQERGETYRWIAAVQDFAARGLLVSTNYEDDSAPTGRPMLLPRLYAAWVCAVAWGLHLFTGDSFPLSVEQAALWEPFISHLLACAAAMWFMGRRHGLAGAAIAAVVLAFFPPIARQFIPGTLSAQSWALILAAGAIAANLPRSRHHDSTHFLSIGSAIAAAAALWLDPAFGFPAVLISAAAGAAGIYSQRANVACMRWALIGSMLTLAGWLVDRAPWDSAAGELRYVHPLYAFAWLGLGLALDAAQNLRTATAKKRLRWVEVGVALPLIGALAYVQLSQTFKGWLYPSVSIRGLTSLDDSFAFDSVFGWLAGASLAEIVFLCTPLLAATVLLAITAFRQRHAPDKPQTSPWPTIVLWLVIIALSTFRLRWTVVAALVTLPLLWHVTTRNFPLHRRKLAVVAAAFLLGLTAWNAALPPSLRPPAAGREPSANDLEALVYRHFAHWLTAHSPSQGITALAPPELADSLVFHAGGRTLMSTAWESYPGQLAATRILSAPESTEAEAVLGGHGVTHVVVPSWDKTLSLFVRKPAGETREPLLERLDRWLIPPYLRPLVYHLPGLPAFAAENLSVFKVTPPEDEALSLSRLAEYFVEMERPEPAALVARVLAESFPQDPNAAIARAIVYASNHQRAEFDRELDRLASDIDAGRTPFLWDRRVQRAIVLALGRRHELARREIEACVTSASREELYELTPLQAYRLETLAKRFHATFPTPELAEILAVLNAELSAAASKR